MEAGFCGRQALRGSSRYFIFLPDSEGGRQHRSFRRGVSCGERGRKRDIRRHDALLRHCHCQREEAGHFLCQGNEGAIRLLAGQHPVFRQRGKRQRSHPDGSEQQGRRSQDLQVRREHGRTPVRRGVHRDKYRHRLEHGRDDGRYRSCHPLQSGTGRLPNRGKNSPGRLPARRKPGADHQAGSRHRWTGGLQERTGLV